MAEINFVVPSSNEELLNATDKHYYVRNEIKAEELPSKLRDAFISYKDEGLEFIGIHFDTFYSIIHQSEDLVIDVIMTAQEILWEPIQELQKYIALAIANIDHLIDETRLEIQNVIKMLLYVYININIAIEEKIEKRRSQNVNLVLCKRKPIGFGNTLITLNRESVLLAIHNIFLEKIEVFWNPSVVDDAFLRMALKICYQYLVLPFIIIDKRLEYAVTHFIGTLIKDYNMVATFSHEIVQLINMCGHLTATIPECVRSLVEHYQCQSVTREVIKELIKWKPEEVFQEYQGTKRSVLVLIKITALMPSLMIREITNLKQYLNNSYGLRIPYLNVITEIIVHFLTKDNLTAEENHSRNIFLNDLEENLSCDVGEVRAYALEHWAQLRTKNAISVEKENAILKKVVGLLRDEFTIVRTGAAICVTAFLCYNHYGPNLQLASMESRLKEKMEWSSTMKSKFDQIKLTKVEEHEEPSSKHLFSCNNWCECEQRLLRLTRAVEFVQLIHDAIDPMKDMIISESVDAAQAAITFFVSIFQFKIDNGFVGFSVMLKLMHSNDQQRKDAVIEAFKIIYLNAHRSIVVRNLVYLAKSTENLIDLELIISETTRKAIIDDDVIDLLWDFFTKQCDVSDNDSVYACCLLSMAAAGDPRIITRNIELVAAIGFGNRGQHNLLLMAAVCKFLSTAKSEKVEFEDKLWSDLIDILVNNFYVKTSLYNGATAAAVNLIYTICPKPVLLCKDFIEKIWATVLNTDTAHRYIITQWSDILGEIVLRHLRSLAELNVSVCSTRYDFANRPITYGSADDNANFEFISDILEKCAIFSSHLRNRFPNIIESWTREVYPMLKDSVFEVRYASFFMLSQLILKDMIPPHGYFLHMAICLVDAEERLCSMAKEFFTQLLLQKYQHFCYVLPDILCLLLDLKDLKEDDLRIIMKFLFGFADKTKQIEYLVNLLCLKFQGNEDNRKCRNIAYCLSLITCNKKTLKKLFENFQSYRNLLHQPEVFVIIRQILHNFSESTNNEIKTVVMEFEEKINIVLSRDTKVAAETSKPLSTGAIKKTNEYLTKKKQN